MAFDGWKAKARKLKLEVYALYIASKDRRVSWYARVVAVAVVAYAFSPIDLIPDPIPVLGYLDDLILIPLGIALVIKLIPAEVMQDCRERAESTMKAGKPKNWVAGGIIILIWVGLFAFTLHYLSGIFTG
ncbi:MAG TPA: DUF1232 domain-containing protein [Desulfobacterales bacterium]|jgi:uncharacterized membrane protein YkvA (DUF1232 family)|nr:DUF1232 domain-containing protein [Desulfobacterales bacterium]